MCEALGTVVGHAETGVVNLFWRSQTRDELPFGRSEALARTTYLFREVLLACAHRPFARVSTQQVREMGKPLREDGDLDGACVSGR